MTSRLDRLFVLLEAGIGVATRRAAARQLGEIQKAHPEELHRLLGRLMKHLRSPAWETRVAAAQAVEAILENVPEWHPPPFSGKKEEKSELQESTGRLRCETFDIERVLQNGALLMGSEGNEYDMDEEALSGADITERLAKQRQQLNARLGLDVAANMGIDITSVYSNEDLCPFRPQTNKTDTPRRPVQELVSITNKPLSSREMNVAKRKARAAFSKHKSRDCSEDKASPEPEVKKIKLEVTDDSSFLDSGAPVPDMSGGWSGYAGWPLEAWCGALQAQLFSAAWEARHGAASALRELLRARVSHTAPATPHMSRQQMEEAHQQWLEDMALRLLCVLALDRFGDFVSDQVVAPVRETCAQTLGVCASKLREERVAALARLLGCLARQRQWEARHGALLGYKYLLHARQDVACDSGAIEHLIAGLSDSAEDVSAVAAGALAPAAGALARARPHTLPLVVARLWQLLREQDDLASPANSYMALLAALMALPEAAELLHPIDLTDVLPRLWPFLDHSTSSVRKATLQTLRTLTRPLVTHSKHKPQENGMTKQESEPQCENTQAHQNSEEERCLRDEKPQENHSKVVENCIKSEKPEQSQNNVAENNCLKGEKSQHNQKSENENSLEVKKHNDSQNKEVEVKGECSTNVNDGVKEEKKIEANGTEYLLWTPELLQDTMRHVYQRVLFEQVYEIQEIAIQVWCNVLMFAPLGCTLVAACPWLSRWLCAAMQPAGLPLDGALLLTHTQERRHKAVNAEMPVECRPAQTYYLAGPEPRREHAVTRARCRAADMLGHLSCYLVQPAPGLVYKPEDESPIDCYVKLMVVYLRSGSALQRLVSGRVVWAWANRMRTLPTDGLTFKEGSCSTSQVNNTDSNTAPPLLVSTLHTALNQALYYDEVALSCSRLLQEARDLLAMMRHYKLPLDGEEYNNMLRLEQVMHMCTISQPMVAAMKSKRVAQTLEERRKNLQTSVAQCFVEQASLNVSVQAALASACVALNSLPEKLNPVIRPLMESIKKEPSLELQTNSAETLAQLLGQLIHRDPCPNHKVLANLKAFLRCDPEVTPRVSPELSDEANGDSGSAGESGSEGKHHGAMLDKFVGILTLRSQQESAERLVPKRGRPPAAGADCKLFIEDEGRKLLRIQRRGAAMALTSLTKHFGEELPEKLPKLWEFISQPLDHEVTDEELDSLIENSATAEELISRLQITEVVSSCLAAGLLSRLMRAACGACLGWARSGLTAVRHAAAKCVAALCAAGPHAAMPAIYDKLIASLEDINSEAVRCGAVESLSRVVEALQLHIVPYIVLLVVPLLGRISDPCESVRLMATRCFATLIQLMPLDGAVPCADQLSEDIAKRRETDKKFLKQLFNPACVPDYRVNVPLCASLRSYQQAGVNWLRFLYEYKLHGVLCDDMGLGKTLQSIVVIAGSHWERLGENKVNPSLVVCPPTLTGHWVFEVNKFIPTKFLKPLQYVGPPHERERLRSQVQHYNLIVASYDIVRKDIDFFSSIKWNYCVLDEGHVIKNGKTKAFQAIKQIVADHRLILSGTPIQNNVLELWSLFDFLMPGLLGTERQFTARYSRPILAAREPKATPHQLQAGALACEALHRQVLPFLLRRVKEDVLKELPPKITQDYYCDLSPIQRQLYEHFSKKHMPGDMAQNAHVFQALRYLQNVCNHPKLVLTPEHPSAASVAHTLSLQGSTLDCIQHAAKLPALKQLLLDCGIGGSVNDDSAIVSQHRALIFCQLKTMLDILESDLLKKHMPNVTYLRLDGSVPPQQRHALVTRFNNDISIDVLLLTTAVGGLGLNLTGADTVIFVEHDWNPMKDLQAMDRAHRIGQKKVVNVYRLITRDTLEEKIMGLQKFKMQTANTVISSENAALETMGTDQLLDLFHLSSTTAAPQPGTSSSSVLETLPELWDDKQYEEEYDMSNFIKGLNKMNQ